MALAPEHPAKFSAEVMRAVVDVLSAWKVEGDILDPFAGTGRIHELRDVYEGWQTYGVELEPEWAAMSPWTREGDAMHLPGDWTNTYAAVVTSPPYGNRMADAYAGDSRTRRCPHCRGTGVTLDDPLLTCAACAGTGELVGSRRHTYRIALGRKLTENSAAGLQWGTQYRAVMECALSEIRRVLVPGGLFLLNISDHVRGGVLQQVPEWFGKQAKLLGFVPLDVREVSTPRNRHGANAELRATCEWLLVYRKPLGADTGSKA